MRYLFSPLLFLLLSLLLTPHSSYSQSSAPAAKHQPSIVTSTCATTATITATVAHLQDLLPGCDYGSWFDANTGYQPETRYFSAYKILPQNAELYLGFGKARPSELDGALLAKFQSNSLTAIYQPSEQGFIDMTPDATQPVIHIPGPDPTDPALPGGSQWDLGNSYVFTPTTPMTVTKHRNLPNVIHTWGMESTTNGLYAAVSSHLGDYKTWTGEVFRSTDRGANWTRVADKTSGVGDYRTYDIIAFNNKLFVVWSDDYGSGCGLAGSSDGGVTWQRIGEFSSYTYCRSRLFIYNNQLLALSSARDGLLALHTNGSVTLHPFSSFKVQDWVYNALAVDASNRLYTVTEDGRIVRTSNLTSWETLVASDRDFITLAYWPNQDKIVVADRGDDGRLWLLNPSDSAITPPSAPAVSISLNGNDVVLQWPTQGGGLSYRVYRNAEKPTFTPPHHYLHATLSSNAWQENGAASQIGGIYYEIRSKNAAGEISAPSKILGKFTFALIPGT
jgi:photosystem II stability/assembly factor-like uncharacterized protein